MGREGWKDRAACDTRANEEGELKNGAEVIRNLMTTTTVEKQCGSKERERGVLRGESWLGEGGGGAGKQLYILRDSYQAKDRLTADVADKLSSLGGCFGIDWGRWAENGGKMGPSHWSVFK